MSTRPTIICDLNCLIISRWKIETVGKNLRRTILTKQLIDCTGGANIVGQIGFPRLREEETQPGTLIFKLGGYDSVRLETTPRDVPLSDLHDLLVLHGAVVPEKDI